MNGKLHSYFSADHQRLDDLLTRSNRQDGTIDQDAFGEFRRGILRHIGMEEKILVPAARKTLGERSFPIAERLRLDHGAIVALLVPPPSPMILAALRAILAIHNRVEEGPDGFYEAVEHLAQGDLEQLYEKARQAPQVPVMPYNDAPFVLDATRRALARAGYNLDDYSKG